MQRVLIVDDNQIETFSLQAEMTRLGYETTCVRNGADGMRKAQQFSPEMILLNPILPDMNGYDFCRKLREKKETAHISIILILSPDKGPRAKEDTNPSSKTKDLKELQSKIEALLPVKTYLDKRIYSSNETQAIVPNSNLMSIVDPITGTLHKKYFQEILTQEFLRAERYGILFSIIVMDVDCFKEVNNLFGHDIGDQILEELSVVIRTQIREVDLLSRYGGDELSILLPQTSCDTAIIVTKRISEAVRVHVFSKLEKGAGWKGRPLTLSMGVCGLPNPAITQAIQILSGADLALMRAKQTGRNRVEVATDADIRLIVPETQ